MHPRLPMQSANGHVFFLRRPANSGRGQRAGTPSGNCFNSSLSGAKTAPLWERPTLEPKPAELVRPIKLLACIYVHRAPPTAIASFHIRPLAASFFWLDYRRRLRNAIGGKRASCLEVERQAAKLQYSNVGSRLLQTIMLHAGPHLLLGPGPRPRRSVPGFRTLRVDNRHPPLSGFPLFYRLLLLGFRCFHCGLPLVLGLDGVETLRQG